MNKFIVIEWIDWSWKGTHTNLLKEKLESKWFKVWILDFPRYEKESSYFVKQYLNWKYWTCSPKEASLFFALDRYDAKKEIEELKETCDFIISNRYITSNLIHQGGKILQEEFSKDSFSELEVYRKFNEFCSFALDLEYNLLWALKPDEIYFLNVNQETSSTLIKKKEKRAYIEGDSNEDIHEKDKEHLKYAYLAGKQLKHVFELLETEVYEIDCYNDKKELKSIEEINETLLNLILLKFTKNCL